MVVLFVHIISNHLNNSIKKYFQHRFVREGTEIQRDHTDQGIPKVSRSFAFNPEFLRLPHCP